MSGEVNGGKSAVAPLLEWVVRQSASDLHLKVGSPPSVRVDGRLQRHQELPSLTVESLQKVIEAVLPQQHQQAFAEGAELDFCYQDDRLGRFRVSICRSQGQPGLVLRHVPSELPDWERLSIPDTAKRLLSRGSGLVLVTGATGSGKSTTVAAMVEVLNASTSRHVVTLEDPIEYLHTERECVISQRELGTDFPNFKTGLERALRQDPDVIVIGELRDLATIELAITAAETGHLVLATLHTTGAPQTIDRIVDAFPPDARPPIRAQLAASLLGVISQSLFPRLGGGRIPAFEIMTVTEAVRSCIRDGKTHQLRNLLQTGSTQGMQILVVQTAELVQRGIVSDEDALNFCHDPEALEKTLISGLQPLRSRRSSPSSSEPVEPLPSPPEEAREGASLLEKLRRG